MLPDNRITPAQVTSLSEGEVFVFGSNLQGIHGAGAARTALRWGARMGRGTGLAGSTYAIPTMFPTPVQIAPYVEEFIDFARDNPGLRFLVTPVGCGIAGFGPPNIAPLFARAKELDNIRLPAEFWEIIGHP